MRGLIDKQIAIDLIKKICKPLEQFLTRHSIGRFLQFIHVFAYISALFIMFFYPSSHLIVFIIFIIILCMFFIFDGCVLTGAEMHYLGRNETVPGNALDLFHLRPANKETDKSIQIAGSLAALMIPIIFVLWAGRLK
jgi:hypothetical protein